VDPLSDEVNVTGEWVAAEGDGPLIDGWLDGADGRRLRSGA
jgi:hypothetical protein